MNRRTVLLLLIVLLAGSIWGCGMRKQQKQKEHAVEYTVLGKEQIPEPLLEMVDKKKQEEFQMTYEDGELLYLLQGYGIQSSGGYSIRVAEVVENDRELHVKTTLIGPGGTKEEQEGISCPYIVIKVENRHKKVIFE